jgi:hypothetical protein
VEALADLLGRAREDCARPEAEEGGACGPGVPLEWDLGLEVDWRRDGCFVSLYLYLQ